MSSLRTKFVVVAFVVQAAVLGTLLLSNQLLLEPWYVWWAKNEMDKTDRFFRDRQGQDPSALLRRLAAETGFRLTLSDHQGQILMSSVPEFRPGIPLFLPKDQRESFLFHRDTLAEGHPWFEVIDKEPKGQSVVSAFYRIDHQIYLNATMPLGQIRRNVAIASTLFLTMGLGVLFLTWIGILAASRQVVEPILRLDRLAQSIASRDFGLRFTSRGDDELVRLGLSMNRMSDQLQAALQETAERNRELAAQIEAQQVFFASVSHEFKTPLGLVRGYAEVLHGLARAPKTSRAQAASIILEEVDRLSRLVDDLLTLSRLGLAEFQMKTSQVDLPSLVSKVVGRFHDRLGAQELGVRLVLPSEGEAALDEARMIQALDNVLSNAIRHAAPQTTVEVVLQKTESYWDLQITNQGAEIEERNLSRIFEPFYRVDPHRNREDGGSGLGLAIVAQILRLHRGRAFATNTGQGVTICLQFPGTEPTAPGLRLESPPTTPIRRNSPGRGP